MEGCGGRCLGWPGWAALTHREPAADFQLQVLFMATSHPCRHLQLRSGAKQGSAPKDDSKEIELIKGKPAKAELEF